MTRSKYKRYHKKTLVVIEQIVIVFKVTISTMIFNRKAFNIGVLITKANPNSNSTEIYPSSSTLIECYFSKRTNYKKKVSAIFSR